MPRDRVAWPIQVAELAGWRNSSGLKSILIAAVIAGVLSSSADAASSHHHSHRHSAAHQAGPLYRAALLEYADSGQVLFQQNADMEWPPASMAKMMLLLVAEDQIHSGRFKLTDPVVISARAATTGGSRLGLRMGQVYPLGELMKAALIRSANDAAVAVAEKVGGSTEGSVRLMNLRARSLGMTGTEYHTVDGLPPTPGHDVDYTNAHDLATLARAIIADTDLLRWSELETALFDNGVFLLHNTNHLIGKFPGCDGLKTGFTFHAGFNLTATAKRGDFRVVAVVLGAPSNAQRFEQAGKLMDWGFSHFTPMPVLARGQRLPVQVRTTSGAVIEPVAAKSVNVAVRRDSVHDIHFRYDVPPLVMGPVRAGASLGHVAVVNGNEVLAQVEAICPRSTISKPATDAANLGMEEGY
jgi:D-alanyl-D-alanine carboxypeptidase (penicillin-binding protein 5/6)